MATARTEPKKRGRPELPLTERKSGNITFRVRDRLQQRIAEEAARSQRSLSEEIERSLEDHYAHRDSYGELARLLGAAVKAIEIASGKRYSDDRKTRIQTRAALDQILDVMVWPHIDIVERKVRLEDAFEAAQKEPGRYDLAVIAADLEDLRLALNGRGIGVPAALGPDFPLATALRRQVELQTEANSVENASEDGAQ